MGDACSDTRNSGQTRSIDWPRAADGLSLAATPVFAIMALLAGAVDGGGTQAICATAHGAALGGMAWMYLLMSVFHVGPWLRRSGPGRARARRRRWRVGAFGRSGLP